VTRNIDFGNITHESQIFIFKEQLCMSNMDEEKVILCREVTFLGLKPVMARTPLSSLDFKHQTSWQGNYKNKAKSHDLKKIQAFLNDKQKITKI
jgi:hypothetical protein